MPLHFLKAIIILIIFSNMVFADTVTYDYASDTSGTPGVDIFAYSGTTSSKPESANTTPSNELNTNNYSYIESENSVYSTNQSSSNNSYASQRFVIEVDEDESSINQLSIQWIGYGENTQNNRDEGIALYIWDYDSSSYEEIDNTGDTTASTTLTVTISSDIGNYIENNTITLFVTANEIANGNSSRYNLVATDYVSISITSETINTPPIAEYRFDETEYNDIEGEVIESISGLNGRAKVAQPVEGKVCNAIDLSSSGTSDYAILDESILNGKTDFTVSLWINTSKTSNQSILSGASTGSYNELIMWFPSHVRFQPHLKNGHNGSITTSSIIGDEDSPWRHLVWTRSGSQSCLYIDAEFQGCLTQSTASLNIDSLILGQEQDSLGGGFVSSQAVEGLIDELLVFDSAISSEKIDQIYENQNNGLGYDGSVRECPTENSILAEYRFEEDSWNGSAEEVIDNTDNNYHAQAINNAQTETTSPAISGNPGTCGYGEFDGVNDYIALPETFPNLEGSFTITAWINPTNSDSGSRIFADDVNNQGGYSLSLGDGGTGELRFYSRNVSPIIVDTGNVISTNTWTFVSAVHNSETQSRQIYVNGVAQTLTGGETAPTYTGSWGTDSGISTIGGESDQGETNNRFTGSIDEVRVYNGALSEDEINEIYAETHTCEILSIDHYEISHNDSALTCSPETITIKACVNSDCSTVYSNDVVVTLTAQSTSGASSIWSENPITIPADSTLGVDVDLTHTTAETVTIDVETDAINPVECIPSCDLTFSDSGFIFDVPTQTACAISEDITISAVQKDDTSQQCVPSFSSVEKTLKFWNEYETPSTGTKQVTLTQNLSEYTLANTEGTSVAILFDINGEATFNVTYPDAGRLQLNASYDGTGDEQDLRMTGSDLFINVPATLAVESNDSNAACSSNDAECTVFRAAEEEFNLSVSATCDDGTITPNFQMQNISLTLNDVAPNIGNPVVLGVTNIDIDATDNGEHTESTQTISEVGVFSITATPNESYFTETIAAVTSSSIGRFTPSYFEVGNAEDGSLSGGDPFVYTGQMQSATSTDGQITYSTLPEFTITAKSVSGLTTLNYTDSFMKLLVTGIERETPTQDAVQLGADEINEVDLSAILNEAVLAEVTPGILKYQFNSTDNYVYTRNSNAIIPPFTASIELQIDSIEDEDVVTANDIDSDDTNGILTLQPEGLEIRFGRLLMENSYGSELAEQRIPMQTQYWTGSNFSINESDSFSSFTATDASVTENNLSPTSSDPSLSGAGLFSNGETNSLIVSPPGANIRGDIIVELNVPSWLEFDWSDDDNGLYDENPSAQVNFGLYRGNDRIIYRREVFE